MSTATQLVTYYKFGSQCYRIGLLTFIGVKFCPPKLVLASVVEGTRSFRLDGSFRSSVSEIMEVVSHHDSLPQMFYFFKVFLPGLLPHFLCSRHVIYPFLLEHGVVNHRTTTARFGRSVGRALSSSRCRLMRRNGKEEALQCNNNGVKNHCYCHSIAMIAIAIAFSADGWGERERRGFPWYIYTILTDHLRFSSYSA